MKWFFILGLFLVSSVATSAANPWERQWRSFEELSLILKSTPRGGAIWAEALKQDPELLTKLRRGKTSLTESTFTRSYSVPAGSEVVSIHQEVSIAANSTLADAVLDLAHELVHFSRREPLSPYDPGIRRDQFIRAGIEGKGGELAAFFEECNVGREMAEHFPGFPKQKLCSKYWTGKAFDEEKMRRDFYATGDGYAELHRVLGTPGGGVLPNLSSDHVVFRSSFAGVSYPVALSREFDQTIETACRNNERKARVLASQPKGSVGDIAAAVERQKLRVYRRVHCGSSVLK